MNPITSIIDLVTTVVSRVFPDKTETEKQRLAVELQTTLAQVNLDLAQIEVNKEEAKNPNFWVAGARPAVMWVGVAILVWTYLARPIIEFTAAATGHQLPPLPNLNMDIMPVVMGLLGLGTMRTVERLKGVIPKGR